MAYAQLVVGPPGAGKTTYCCGVQQLLQGIGRPTTVVNLDPANDALPYDFDVDVAELVDATRVMDELELGPNGALLYAMEYIEANFDWLEERLRPLIGKKYVLFDCPGQVELYTNHPAMRGILAKLEKLGFRLCAVNLVDSHYCTEPSKFLSVSLMSLSVMLHLALPHVNVLSKVDLIESHGAAQFRLDFYTEMQDPLRLADALNEDPRLARFKEMNVALAHVLNDYSLVGYVPLNIRDKNNVANVLRLVDKANGYVFGSLEYANDRIMEVAADEHSGIDPHWVADLQEQYYHSRDAAAPGSAAGSEPSS